MKMTTAQVVETPVTVNNKSLIQGYVYPDDQTQPNYEMTLWFKLFTEKLDASKKVKENALASEGKSCRPEKITAKKLVCVSGPLSLKKAPKITFSQFTRRILQSIIYPPEKKFIEQAAFGAR